MADLTCPQCGGDMGAVNIGQPVTGCYAITIVQCDPCGQQYEIAATLRPFGPKRPARARLHAVPA